MLSPVRLASVTLLVVATSGCVTIYQPLVGLQRPTVLDPSLDNFAGTRLRLRCVPGAYVDADHAKLLCERLNVLFGNQGAEIVDHGTEEAPAQELGGGPDEAPPDLVIQVSSRLLDEQNNGILWALSAMSFTLVPAFSEHTFAQDISVRDSEGFLLASDTLQGRVVEYFGGLIWVANAVLDVAVRRDEEELTGDTASHDLSRDMYRQLSQLVFNARARLHVMREAQRGAP